MEGRVVLLLALVLVGCSSTGKVANCESDVADFWSKGEYRALAIHPRGCYAAWDEPWSSVEAQRRALLLCGEANPDSDTRCTIIVTDKYVCPIGLRTWAKEHSRLDREEVRNTLYISDEEQCELGPAVEVKNAPGTKPPPVDSPDDVATKDVVAFFNLQDYEPDSSDVVVTYRTLYHVSQGFAAEALHFLERQDGKRMCILRAFSQWDPRNRELDTRFTVRLLGCFEM